MGYCQCHAEDSPQVPEQVGQGVEDLLHLILQDPLAAAQVGSWGQGPCRPQLQDHRHQGLLQELQVGQGEVGQVTAN